jgi:hypothetical protein
LRLFVSAGVQLALAQLTGFVLDALLLGLLAEAVFSLPSVVFFKLTQ